jgi:hypothetical protein
MKTFNVPQFYNGFCYYFKFICSSFDKVIKLFTLFCVHPLVLETITGVEPWSNVQHCAITTCISTMKKKRKTCQLGKDFLKPYSQLLMSFKSSFAIANHLQLDRNDPTRTSKPHYQQK